VINFALFRLCVDGFGLGRILATAIAVPPSTVVVFLLLNYRVFRARLAGR
jgi:putative flippase GtrA